jgi:serine/threonine protein kinase
VEFTSFTPPTIEALNKLLPSYHFVSFIAQGGMGAVYLAKQISLDREVAVKILPRELSEDPEFRSSFQTEARAMARLNHPNLISIYESGDVDGMLYIAMEYVPGKSLYHSAWNKKIDPKEASRIIIAICDGLAHAHENGIIHRDIKPANILLNPKIEPKIGDFGLAQRVGVKHDGIVMGTPGYTAPEVISHPEKADRRSDIFAVGVMLHELLTGKKPEANQSASSICQCSPDYDTVIQRATHPNPVMRYPDAGSMAKAIRDILDNKPKAGPLLNTSKAVPRGAALVKPQALGRPMSMKAAAAASSIPASPSSAPLPAATQSVDVELPPLLVKSNNASWHHVRNLLIIAALCVIVVFVYQKLQIHREDVAKREREYIIKQKEEEMRRRREIAEETARIENPATVAIPTKPSNIPSRPVIEDAPETPMESLDRLRYDLSKGARAEMPIGSRRRGDLDVFLVTTPMTWDEATLYAETLGAHIALPTSEDDITFYVSFLKNNETIWLGAGRSGKDSWVNLDGTTWSLGKAPSGLGSIATVSHLGIVRAADSARELPFLIAWHRDGSNPCSLGNLLQITRRSQDAQTQIYPPGTIADDSRHYLPILRPLKYSEALALAQQGGAHIAALSNREEGYWVKDHLVGIRAPRGIFLGGEKSGGVWKWSTNEPWVYADWAPDAPDDEEDSTRLVYLPKRGWHNLDKNEQADGVLLEWSKDAQSASTATNNLAGATPDIGALITRCRSLLTASIKDRDDKLAANLKAFEWDLDVWLRGLKPTEKPQWQETVTIFKTLCRRGRVPSAEDFADAFGGGGEGGNRIPALHANIVKIHTYCFNKQNEIETEHVTQNEKIRDSYVSKIKEMGTAAQKTGQFDLVRQMKEFIDDAENLDSWVREMVDD